MNICDKSPKLDWMCRRKKGHEGSCAAVLIKDELEEIVKVFNSVLDYVSGTYLELEDCMDADEYRVVERIRHYET